jgi:hypothetical protein
MAVSLPPGAFVERVGDVQRDGRAAGPHGLTELPRVYGRHLGKAGRRDVLT